MESGSKVRVFVMFRGREMTHQEFGRKILDRVIEELKEIAQIDVAPKMDGYTMSMIISPQAKIVRQALAGSEATKE